MTEAIAAEPKTEVESTNGVMTGEDVLEMIQHIEVADMDLGSAIDLKTAEEMARLINEEAKKEADADGFFDAQQWVQDRLTALASQENQPQSA